MLYGQLILSLICGSNLNANYRGFEHQIRVDAPVRGRSVHGCHGLHLTAVSSTTNHLADVLSVSNEGEQQKNIQTRIHLH
jgi:hypothetical protein